ncbi:hypothetical protein I601_1617 [Nocardioides dokdonensis FR1436]|uniref:Uncharacterized protein n=1 Tax=Nocardioides dokdonensis FR1436 TaxID=1300347 RepID=A0A1A9GIA2_9ACTN|nr:hypothetical protein [Nocardioides dokdonensis]ANH38049.1 hypothetical protein I601_1617 [Nocardioides dokdonensis FR1436]
MDTHDDAQVIRTRMRLMQELNRIERRDPVLSARVRLQAIDLHRAWTARRLDSDEYALRLTGLCDQVCEHATPEARLNPA